MTTHEKHQAPWYLWPFVAIWKLLAIIVEMTKTATFASGREGLHP